MSKSANNLLDFRVQALERRIVGDANVKQLNLSTNLIDQLLQIESKLKVITTGKERFKNCNQKLSEYEKLLNPDYFDTVAASDAVKFEELVNREDEIRREAAQLERIKLLEKNIDSPQLRNFNTLNPKLNQIQEIALKQCSRMEKLNQETARLLQEYNQWLSSVKKQLVVWDEKITELEKQKKEKKTTNLEFD